MIIDGTVYVPVESTAEGEEPDRIPWLAEEDLIASN